MNNIISTYGPDPIALFRAWFADAREQEINDPEAAALATANAQGHPSIRWVLIKQIDERGFRFHTNAESQKGREIAENPHGELCFYWKSLRKQVRIRGKIHPIEDGETQEYFWSRSRASQIGAWASDQSRELESPEQFQHEYAKIEKRFEGEDNIPCPPHWQGYRLKPESMEFWIAQRDRLHTRFRYELKEDGEWTAVWLYP